jgi:hypothetical protein
MYELELYSANLLALYSSSSSRWVSVLAPRERRVDLLSLGQYT